MSAIPRGWAAAGLVRLCLSSLLLSGVSLASTSITIRGADGTAAVFGADPLDGATFGALASLSIGKGPSAVASGGSRPPVWKVDVVTREGGPPIVVESTHGSAARVARAASSGAAAVFSWNMPLNVTPRKSFNVTMAVSIDAQGLLSYDTLTFGSSDRVGVWAWTLYPAGETTLSKGSVFEPSGFGIVHHLADESASYSRAYPQATMQFMAAFPPPSSSMVGTYVGAHDKLGSSKTLGCVVAADGETVRFSISATPPDAGLPLQSLPHQQMTVDFPIVVAALDDSGLEDDWFAAAEIYRGFVIPHASWTQQGPLSKRDDVPLWAQELTVWVNSHWQPNDIFNVSGGAPSVVENRVAQGAVWSRERASRPSLVRVGHSWVARVNYSICSARSPAG